MRTGGKILVDNLLLQGADLAFCVPGESFLEVLDAMYDARDRMRLIVCRQEGGAAYMAEAYGKLTGRPGLLFVTRGPGASNAAIGIHTAQQDSTPLIAFIGQVGSDFKDREAFQEVDYARMYGGIAKWVTQIERADRIPEYVAQAYRVAMSGRPGPVVLALPEDMLTTSAEALDSPRVVIGDVTPRRNRSIIAHTARRREATAGRCRWERLEYRSVRRPPPFCRNK
jgi:acetolactate synthase-1/2/3 large subunit